MELEELKDIWQKSRPDFQPKDEAEIASMLKGKSKSIIAKLKQSVWFELIFTFVAGLAMLVYALLLPSGAAKWTSVSILILFIAYTFYYIKKLLLLRSFNQGDDHLKANLQRLADSLTSYLTFYKRSYSILYPVYFCLGLLFGLLESGSDRFFEMLSKPKVIGYLIATAATFFFISTWFTKWYLKKLYGNQLEKLKCLLKDLNSNPT
jgi:uncharacterized MAPEG superfamily protein